MLGFLVVFPWETQPVSLVALAAATALGKALGGILADRCGWIRTGVGGTLAALPLLAVASRWPDAAIPGLFLLNLAMPVTLVAVARTMPGHPAFAFGLTCLALLLGALPSLLGLPVNTPWFVAAVVLISALVLDRGLRRLPSYHSLPTSVEVCK